MPANYVKVRSASCMMYVTQWLCSSYGASHSPKPGTIVQIGPGHFTRRCSLVTISICGP